MWNRWRGKLAGEGLLRRANQTVTDRAAGRTDHRQASGGAAAAVRDVCSGVPAGHTRHLPRSLRCRRRAESGGDGPGPVPRPSAASRPLLPQKRRALLSALPWDKVAGLCSRPCPVTGLRGFVFYRSCITNGGWCGEWQKCESTWVRGLIQENDKGTSLKGGRAVGRRLPTGLGPSDERNQFSDVLFLLGGGTSLLINESLRGMNGGPSLLILSHMNNLTHVRSKRSIGFLVQVRGSHVWEDYEVMPRVGDRQLEREMKTKFYRGKGKIKSWSVAREIRPITTWFCFIRICDTFKENVNKKLLRVLHLLFELVCILSAEGL